MVVIAKCYMAFITIPIGNIVAGSFHAYLCGMTLMQNDRMQMPTAKHSLCPISFFMQ